MNNMNYFQKFFGHLRTVRTHRKMVRYYCKKMGFRWQGWIHDLSKYSPVEFFESVKYYQGNRSPIDAAKENKGYSDAWFHHRGRNKHHREFWVDHFDNGTSCIPMPDRYAIEMLADYLGAGTAYQGKNFSFQSEWEWWLAQLDKNICIHPQTAHFITTMLRRLAKFNCECVGTDLLFEDVRHIWIYSCHWWEENQDKYPRVYYGRSLDFKEDILGKVK